MADEKKAAFGVFPQMKPRRSRQDPEAAKDVPRQLLRGWAAGTLGLPGDIEGLIRMLPGLDETPRLPTSEFYLDYLPGKAQSPAGEAAAGLGTLFGGVGSTKVARGALKAGEAAGKAGRAALETVGSGPSPGGLAAQRGVVKMPGGNWISGNVERAVEPLKKQDVSKERIEGLRQASQDERVSPNVRQDLAASYEQGVKDLALNDWVDRNLSNYIKKQMGTPDDPVRKLIEETGAVHNPLEETWQPESLGARRKTVGFPAEGFSHKKLNELPEGADPQALDRLKKAGEWESRVDQIIDNLPVKEWMNLDPQYLAENPWMSKVDPNTMAYRVSGYTMQDELGFDHIIDVLRQDLAAGRIRPEQLNKVSMEQAVRRTYEYDQEMAKKMAEAQIKATEGMPLYKEYPEGYKWIELAPPTYKAENLPAGFRLEQWEYKGKPVWSVVDEAGVTQNDAADSADEALKRFGKSKVGSKALEDALKYEGETMGHCVGGYCPDVIEGRSRIFSLRDAKGEPHVTVEVQPNQYAPRWENVKQYMDQAREQVMKDRAANGLPPTDQYPNEIDRVVEALAVQMAQKNSPPNIVQIKGKQNRAPKEEYLPYVQDFVKSGQWSDVGDLRNTGLVKVGSEYIPKQEVEAKIRPRVNEALQFLETHPSLEQFRAAQRAYDEFRGDVPSPEYTAIQRAAGRQIAEGVPYTYRELEALLKNPEEWVERGEDIYGPLSKTLEQIDRARKLLGEIPPAEGMKRGGKVRFTDNPDAMRLELAGGGLAKLKKLVKGAQETPKPLERAPAKSKEEIRAIAERIAPQMTGEYVRGKGAQTIAGKTQKQFQREKGLQHDIRPTGQSIPEPETVNIESLKDKVMIGIAGDPSIGGQTVYRVGDVPLESPSPQHAGPLYGLGRDDQKFWASGKGAATRVQNLADEVAQQYGDREVLGNYIMMTPDSANYAQHFADANLQAIDLSKMTKQQIEQFNELIRRGNAKSGPRPSFPGIEDKGAAYLHFSIDPKLRIHFNELMQMPTVTERLNLPSGADVLHAITEPDLRDLERGVTGKSIGRMIPGGKLTLSEHPTYSHDIPGEFMGSSKYPMPYELTFPDTLKSVRENPEQAPQEFGSLKLVGPRQIIDQQLIDEIRMYEEMIKALTGRAEGGAVEMAGGGTMSKVAMEAIAKLKLLREEAAAKAAQQAQYAKEMEGLATRDMPTFEQWKSVQDKKTGYAAGGEITADDLIIEERPL